MPLVKRVSFLLSAGAAFAVLAAEPAFRYAAPVTVQRSAAFVELPLPAAAYGRSVEPGLADLRLVDARGERVPFAFLPAPPAQLQREELQREAAAYPLPRRSAPGAALASPVEVLVQGDTIRVRRTGSTNAAPPPESPGWLFDLGDPKQRTTDEPRPHALRLAWSSPAEFGVGFDLDASADLRAWQPLGSGQLLQLPAPGGAGSPLVQREVALPPGVPRFVRLVWRELAAAPQLSGATALSVRQGSSAPAAPSELTVGTSPEPASKTPAPPRALHFDLGGALPVVALDLKLPPGPRVAPVRLQGRTRADEAWRELGSAVFYRLEREGVASVSPAVPLEATLRYVRVLPDERSAALDAASTQLVAKAHLARIVFAAQGQPPYRLLAGAAGAAAGALPVSTLVPQLDQERARLGQAELGAFAEETAVAQQAASAERQAALRPWLLWAVLLVGVAGLGFMVWRLATARPPTPGP